MISVIICAAGSGSRASLGENKILHELNGLSILSYSLSAFAPYADEIIVACRKEDEARIQTLLAPYPNAKTVLGGNTRTESVKRALKSVTADVVLIHDAARPFVTKEIIERCIASVKEYGSGVCALPATDTTAICSDGAILSIPPRENVFALQTPQGFLTKELRAAYQQAVDDYTDDSSVYAEFIGSPHVFLGDRCNKKLTYADDFAPAERVGFGVDTHAFSTAPCALSPDPYVTLAGIKIPAKNVLIAHSDGDVLAHALMDALLSAIGERDIGYHFPDTDPKYENANSMELLSEVVKMVHEAGFSVKNASISVLAEMPRLSPYIEEMRANLRTALDCENVAVAAGTNEKLGYIGEGKGITVYVTVLLTNRV